MFRVLESLPVYGEPAMSFSSTGYGLHSEGLVVEFQMIGGASWIGNFIGGLSDFDHVTGHPNASDVVVVSGGQGFVVSPNFRRVTSMFGGAIMNIYEHLHGSLILNHQNLSFEAIGKAGSLWKSKRISWDGMRNIGVEENSISGEAWRYDGTWHPFLLDLTTGGVIGGAYEG